MSGEDAGTAVAMGIAGGVILFVFLSLAIGEAIVSIRKQINGDLACERCGKKTVVFRIGGNRLWRCHGCGATYG